jgi:hypothetical protein
MNFLFSIASACFAGHGSRAVRGKAILKQAVEAHRFVRRRGSHIF